MRRRSNNGSGSSLSGSKDSGGFWSGSKDVRRFLERLYLGAVVFGGILELLAELQR